jgi:hypothetical protein
MKIDYLAINKLITDLEAFEYIIDNSKGVANLIMLDSQIFREAKETLTDLLAAYIVKITE